MTTVPVTDFTFPARDGLPLAATRYDPPAAARGLVVLHSATAVARRFYRAFATALAEAGYQVLTYDYRGIGGSRPERMRGFEARMRDWALLDMNGALDWARAQSPERLFFVGHSVGGQVAGLLEDPSGIDGMLTFSAQSGYWALQGGSEKWKVYLHMHATFPALTGLFGYMPWRLLGAGEDLPKGVAREWSGWCRDPKYLLGDDSLPLERYADFSAPVLAYSFDDDDWGTPRAVDAMMGAYPNMERRHVTPADVGVPKIGHFGYFRPASRAHWRDPIAWLDARAPTD